MKRIDRDTLAEGLYKVMQEQYDQIAKKARETAEKELEYDQNILTVIDLQEKHPELKHILDLAIDYYKSQTLLEKTRHLKSYIGYAEEKKIRAQLELYSDKFLKAHTLEELASVLRP